MRGNLAILMLLIALVGLVRCNGTDKDGDDSNTAQIRCTYSKELLLPGESTTLTYSFVNAVEAPLTFEVDLETDPSLYFKDTGVIGVGAATSVAYTAPALISEVLEVPIKAETADGLSGNCTVVLIPTSAFGYDLDDDDTGPFKTPVATYYESDIALSAMPAISSMTATGRFLIKEINYNGQCNGGTPFATTTGLQSNYAVRIEGKIAAATSGVHRFRVASNDQTIFTFSGGGLAPLTVTNTTSNSANATLTPGVYGFSIDHYQGTGACTLVLQWRTPGSGVDVAIPSSSLNP